jgi:SlyX protein
MDIEEGMIELQTKYAYQEDLLQTLNDIVTAQQAELAMLKDDMKRMRESLRSTMNSQIARPEEDIPPPHY